MTCNVGIVVNVGCRYTVYIPQIKEMSITMYDNTTKSDIKPTLEWGILGRKGCFGDKNTRCIQGLPVPLVETLYNGFKNVSSRKFELCIPTTDIDDNADIANILKTHNLPTLRHCPTSK